MFKKSLLVLILLLFFSHSYAEETKQDFHAGTPEGFYDDIKIEDIEKEELEDIEREEQEKSHLYSENNTENDDVIIVHPTKTKTTKNYAQIYRDLEVPSFSYQHNIDPDQFYDTKDATWSIYPLLRLISPLYFKNITIEPGYYLLTPREHKGKWYMLFKQNGIVKHIIPVYNRDYTPEMFYDEHIPKPKLTKAQKMHMGFLDFIGRFGATKRKPPVQTYLEVNDLENYFVSIVIYYGAHQYFTIFRTVKL